MRPSGRPTDCRPPVRNTETAVSRNSSRFRPQRFQAEGGGGSAYGVQPHDGRNGSRGTSGSKWGVPTTEAAARRVRLWRSLPGLKRIVRPGGIRTSLPVRGLRPMPRLRGLTWKTPNPRSSIRSPFIRESFMASRTASTATSARTFVMSAARATSLMMSTLIMKGWTSC